MADAACGTNGAADSGLPVNDRVPVELILNWQRPKDTMDLFYIFISTERKMCSKIRSTHREEVQITSVCELC